MVRAPADAADGANSGAVEAAPKTPKRAKAGPPQAPPKPSLAAPAAQPAAAQTAAPQAAASHSLGGGAGGAADMSMAGAAMSALAMMSAQYGRGTPSVDTGQPTMAPSLSDGRPKVELAYDGNHLTSAYHSAGESSSRQAGALGAVNAELNQILGGTAASTTTGKATIGSIIAEVDTALTALGKVSDNAASKQLVAQTLHNALARATSTYGQGQSAAAVSAAKVDALAARYVRESGGGAPQPRRTSRSRGHAPPRTRPSGAVGQWVNEALQVLAQHGYDTRRINPADIAAIIAHESSGNPHAINLWDSNAAAGIPSKGLMQTIDPTFNAHSLPGHKDIWNPVDNIIAGVRYAISRYGSVSDVPGIENLRSGSGYVGY